MVFSTLVRESQRIKKKSGKDSKKLENFLALLRFYP